MQVCYRGSEAASLRGLPVQVLRLARASLEFRIVVSESMIVIMMHDAHWGDSMSDFVSLGAHVIIGIRM